MSSSPVHIKVLGDEITIASGFRYKDLCKGLSHRRWDPDLKVWVVPALPAMVREVYEAFRGCEVIGNPEWTMLTEALVERGEGAAPKNHVIEGRSLPSPKLVKTQPWAHQVLGYHLIADQPGTMLAFDMGTGKTKTTIDAIVNLDCKLTLVICPLAVVPVWPEQFRRHAARPVEVMPLHENSVAGRMLRLKQAIDLARVRNQPLVAVCNYEGVWREPLDRFLESVPWDLIVCDESHRIKSPKGKASKFLAQLGRIARRRLCLTGTPMPHSPLDIWAQYRFLDRSIFGTSFTEFRSRYTRMGGFGGHEILGYQNLEELTERFYRIAYRVNKDDVLDLPEVMHDTISVELSDTAWKVYKDLERNLVAEIEQGVVTAANALARLIRLQQATSGFAMVRPSPEEDPAEATPIDDAKVRALTDYFEDIHPSEPVVVFSRFTYDLARIKEAAAACGRKAFELSGAAKELEAWQQSKGGDVLAAQIQTGREGVDFTRARYAIYYSLGYSLGDYLQSLARIHRPGQTRKVFYLHLVAKDTVDEEVYAALSSRKQVVEHVLDTLKAGVQSAGERIEAAGKRTEPTKENASCRKKGRKRQGA